MLRWEIKKLTRNVWNIPIITSVICLWGIMLYFSAQARFWYILGSLALGFIILFISTRLFILDEEEKVSEVILATKYGRWNLLFQRVMTAGIYTTGIVIIFLFIQVIGVLLFNRNEIDVHELLTVHFLKGCLLVWGGSVLFSVFTACLCTIFKSHGVTAILSGILFGMTYILRGNLLQQYSFEWFLEKGFFSYLIRGENGLFEPQWFVIIVWYVFLMGSMITITIIIQFRRHEI